MARMRILMVTAEYAPFAKTGGLADMVAGLCRALISAGHDVRVVLPRYRGLERLTTHADVPRASAVGGAEVSPVRLRGVHPPYEFEHMAAAGGPQIYRVDAPAFFGSGGIYGGGETEALRFALLSHAALRLCQVLGWGPQIVHCHDWHAALAPMLLNAGYLQVPLFRGASSVLTIHNIGYQGVFSGQIAADLGIGRIPWPAAAGSDPASGDLNFLRAGITAADALTTVSPTHATEILTAEYGKGLEGLLRQRRNRLVGILNGVDYGQWDPATDTHLPYKYTPGDLSGKLRCREKLRQRSGLEDAGDLPVLGMVSRLAEQKGIELALGALPDFLRRGELQAVVLGEGEARYATALRRMADAFPGRFSYVPAQDETFARLVFAGADAFLVPSLYEPCGLTQMYALRYGSVPVVRDTGGLRDTVSHFDPATGTGTGSVFRHPDITGLSWAINEVLAWRRSPDAWQSLLRNGMYMDFSWAHQAPHYLALYRRLAGVASPPTEQSPRELPTG